MSHHRWMRADRWAPGPRASRTRASGLRRAAGAMGALCEQLESRQLLAVDLTGSFTFTGGSYGPGATIADIPVSISNLGNELSDFVPLRFVLSTNSTIGDADDIILASFVIDQIAGGGSAASIESLLIPTDVAAGNYFLFLLIDPDNQVSESNEGNNQFSTATASVVIGGSPVFADLTVSLGTLSGTFLPGQQVQGSITIRNLGQATADNFVTRLVLSRNTIFGDGDDIAIEDIPEAGNGGFRPGEVFTGSGSIFIPGVIAPGSYYLMAMIDVNNDVAESNEGNNVYRSATASVVIAPPPVVSITALDNSASETAPNNATFRLSRTGPTTLAMTVDIVITGTAIMGADYESIALTVTFAAGSSTAIITIVPIDDMLVEPTETVIISVGAGEGYTVSGTQAIATVTIADNEPTISVALTRHASETPSSTGLFTFTRTGGPLGGALTVYYSLGPSGTATPGVDFVALSGIVTFAAGSATATVEVTGIEDMVVEPTETVVVRITADASYTLSATANTATMNLLDNEPTITVVATRAVASETPGNTGLFTFTRSGGTLAGPLTINFQYLSSGTAIPGQDYQSLPGSITFADGVATVTLEVFPIDDSLVEPDETLGVQLLANAAYRLGTATTATITILDNEPTITLVATDAVASETAGDTATFTFRRIGGYNAGTLTVYYSILASSTAIGNDYLATPGLTGQITFAAGSDTATIVIAGIDDTVVEPDETIGLTLIANNSYRLGAATTAIITILDNEPTITLVATDPVADETPGNTATFTFTRIGGPLTGTLTVLYSIGTSTANGTDFIASPTLSGSITFAAGSATATITITPIDDTIPEADETLMLTLIGQNSYRLGTAASATITILDNEPIVSVAAPSSPVAEGGAGPIVFTLTRASTGLGAALTVTFTLTGTASVGGDYVAVPLSATFAAGSATTTVTITLIDDALAENPESIILTITPGATFRVSPTAGTATATIADNEPIISVAAVGGPVQEGSPAPIEFRLTRAAPSVAAPLTVFFTLGGTATHGVDYTTVTLSVTFAAGSSTAMVSMTVIDDLIAEATETIILSLSANGAYHVSGSQGSATSAVLDNEPTVSVAAIGRTAVEGGTAALTFLFTRASGNTALALTANFVLGGTATMGQDYETVPLSVTFAPGQTTVMLTLTVIDDALAEPEETVVVELAGSTAYRIDAARASATGVIGDNEPTISVTATDRTAGESARRGGVDPGLFTLRRVGPLTGELTVSYILTGTATAGLDYVALSGTVTFAAGSATATVVLQPIDDALAEPMETVILTIGWGTGYRIDGLAGQATVTIADNEPVVSIVANRSSASEAGPAAGQFTVRRVGSTSANLTVQYLVSGTAASGSDYIALSGSVVILAGQTSAVINLMPIADQLAEDRETVTLTLTATAGYTPSDRQGWATATITDNAPTVSIRATDSRVGEWGDAGAFTVTRTGPTTQALTVYYTLGGTATPGSDYAPLVGEATIAAGATSAVITLLPLQDTLGEGAETAVITLLDDGAYRTAARTSSAWVAIADDEPVVQVVATDARAVEGAIDTSRFTFSRTGSVAESLTVTYAIGGTAGSGDYSALSGTVTFAAGQSTAIVLVTALEDGIAEGDETLILTVVDGAGYAASAQRGAATATIRANGPQVAVRATDRMAGETGAGARANPGRFTITRVGDRTAALTVFYHFEGTAGAGDYAAPGTSITFQAGQSSVIIDVVIIDDSIAEDAETVVLVLDDDDAYGISARGPSATVTIADDEPRVMLRVTDRVASENGTDTARFTVRRTGPTTGALTVSYVVSGTAEEGEDFEALSGTVTIAAGATTADIFVTALADAQVDPGETVILTLVHGPGYRAADSTPQVATITHVGQADLAITGLSFSGATFSVSEAGQTLGLSLTMANLGAAAAGAFTIEIRLSRNTTFGDGDDFVLSFVSVSVLDALTSTTLNLQLLMDAMPVPPTTGAYYVGVRIDAAGRVAESNESNNDRFSPGATILIAA